MVVKGYSKSAGYQPGVSFEDNRFRNSWNAVYVASAWRFVQCNWGARHLVNAKEVPKPGKAKSDSLRSVVCIHSRCLRSYWEECGRAWGLCQLTNERTWLMSVSFGKRFLGPL